MVSMVEICDLYSPSHSLKVDACRRGSWNAGTDAYTWYYKGEDQELFYLLGTRVLARIKDESMSDPLIFWKLDIFTTWQGMQKSTCSLTAEKCTRAFYLPFTFSVYFFIPQLSVCHRHHWIFMLSFCSILHFISVGARKLIPKQLSNKIDVSNYLLECFARETRERSSRRAPMVHTQAYEAD